MSAVTAVPARRAARPERAVLGRVVAGAALAAAIGAQVVGALVDPVVGAAAAGLLVAVLAVRWVLAGDAAALALALVPLGQLTALALTPRTYGIAAYALTGLPLLVGVGWALRCLAPAGRPVPRWRRPAWHEALVALAGIPLSWVAYTELHLPVLHPPRSALTLAAGIPVVFLVAGALEELLFRGLVQRTLVPRFGRLAVVLAALVEAAAFVALPDRWVLAAVAGVGLAAGAYVHGTGRLAPVVIAHGLLAAGALVVWPAFL